MVDVQLQQASAESENEGALLCGTWKCWGRAVVVVENEQWAGLG